MDYRSLVSRADFVYRSPASRGEDGTPIGNGRMGTMVWTADSAVCFQINRSDVFAVNRTHRGPQHGPADYCGGCAQVRLDVGEPAFNGAAPFRQYLSLYDAECTIVAGGVSVRCFVSSCADVLVLEIDDQRAEPKSLRATLSLWRENEVRNVNHLAQCEVTEKQGTIYAVQRYREGDYACGSAVAIAAPQGDAVVERKDERTISFVLPPRNGKRTVLIASSASWSPAVDLCAEADRVLASVAGKNCATLRQEHTGWWQAFWSRTFVHLTSADGVADFMERLRHLHLYYMASCSRGVLPPKFNGLLFTSDGDTRTWGSQFWLWNTELMYYPLLAADALDLAKPFFDLYTKMLPECEKAAQQRWGVAGAYYPETMAFDGPALLPEDVAQEFQDVIYGRKPYPEFSPKARDWGQFCSHLNALSKERGPETPEWALPVAGRYSWISHIISSGADFAIQTWWRYRFTGDSEWLRSSAYPVLRATVEFYRNFARPGVDGRLHLYPTNAHENFWGVRDGVMDLAAIRGTVPVAIRAAEILGVDADLRETWREFLAKIAPYPMGSEPEAQALNGNVVAADAWASARMGDVQGLRNGEELWLSPVYPFEDVTLETADPALFETARRTFLASPHRARYLDGTLHCIWDRMAILTARMGYGEELPLVLANMAANHNLFANGLSPNEGTMALANEPLAAIATAIQDGLVQCVSPRPGEPEVIRILPAWPKAWTASFRLLVRGGFLVSASVRNGTLECLEIESRRGEECRLRNPWGTVCIVTEAGQPGVELTGDLIRFATKAGSKYAVHKQGRVPTGEIKIAPTSEPGPVAFSLTLPNGKKLSASLGR